VLERIVEWSPATRSLFLRLPAGVTLPFKPGQFISLALPVGGEEIVRPYSLASDPEDGNLLEVCVDLVPGGLGSPYLFALRPGAPLALKGPFGTLVVDEAPAAEMVFIADGTAIAPIRPMLRRVLAGGGTTPIAVLHGARTEADLLYRGELAGWVRAHSRLRWEPVLAGAGTASGENPPLEARVAARYVQGDARRDRHFWICAVGSVVGRLRDLLRGAGYERRAVRYEQW
jgi:ferredoxin-NADP reductase